MDPDESIMSSSGIDGIGCEVAKKPDARRRITWKLRSFFRLGLGVFFTVLFGCLGVARSRWPRCSQEHVMVRRGCDSSSLRATCSPSRQRCRPVVSWAVLPPSTSNCQEPKSHTLHQQLHSTSLRQPPRHTSHHRRNLPPLHERTYDFPFQATIRFHHQLALDMRRHFHTLAPSSTSTTSTAEPPTPVPSTGNHPPPPPPRRGAIQCNGEFGAIEWLNCKERCKRRTHITRLNTLNDATWLLE